LDPVLARIIRSPDFTTGIERRDTVDHEVAIVLHDALTHGLASGVRSPLYSVSVVAVVVAIQDEVSVLLHDELEEVSRITVKVEDLI